MATKTSSRMKELNEQLALLVSCMNTIEVLTVLAERAASPREIADILGLKTPTVCHHVKKLLNLRMIELIEEKDAGGTMQHVYRAIIRPIICTEEWDKLSLEERERYSIWIVQLILIDASKSFANRLFDVHSDNHLSRIPMIADRRGLTEVSEIQTKALDDITQTQAIIADRMIREGTTGMNIIAAMMCFQLPEPPDPRLLGDGQRPLVSR